MRQFRLYATLRTAQRSVTFTPEITQAMLHLSHQDFDKVSAFLRTLYAEVDFARFPKVALDGLNELIPCEHSGYNEINSKTNSAFIHMQPLVPEVLQLAPVLEAHFSEHPQLNHYRANADRTPYQFTDFISHGKFREMGIYREFYRHVDTEHQMACVLSDEGAECDIGIGINRRNRAFSNRDRVVLEFLRPHLIQARQNALAFTGVERRLELLSVAIDDLRVGIVTLGGEGNVSWASPRAEKLLERYYPRREKNLKSLPEALDRWVRECRSRLKAGATTVTLVSFCACASESRLTVRYAPGASGGDRLLVSEEVQRDVRVEGLARGLTSREADVMHWMAEGKTNPEIAIILGISPRTIHKHVERIFAKLKVQTRSAAVREMVSKF